MNKFMRTLRLAWKATATISAILFLVVALVNLVEEGVSIWECVEELLAAVETGSLPVAVVAAPGYALLFASEAVTAVSHHLRRVMEHLSKLARWTT